MVVIFNIVKIREDQSRILLLEYYYYTFIDHFLKNIKIIINYCPSLQSFTMKIQQLQRSNKTIILYVPRLFDYYTHHKNRFTYHRASS